VVAAKADQQRLSGREFRYIMAGDAGASAEEGPGGQSAQAPADADPGSPVGGSAKSEPPLDTTSMQLNIQQDDANERRPAPPEEGSPDTSKLELQLKHGRFTLGWGVKEYVVVPEKVNLLERSSELIRTLLQHWKLSYPKMLLTFQSGLAHPCHLHALEDFPFMATGTVKGFRKHTSLGHLLQSLIAERLGRGKKGADETVKMDGMEPDVKLTAHELRRYLANVAEEPKDEDDSKEHLQKAVDILNQQDFKKGVIDDLNKVVYHELKEVMDTIVSTAGKAGCWILVSGGADGGHFLLEESLADCKGKKPVVLVVDSPNGDRYNPDKPGNWKRIETPRHPQESDEEASKKKEEVKKAVQTALTKSQEMFRDLRKNAEEFLRPAGPTVPLSADFWRVNGKEGWTISSSKDPGAENIRWTRWSFRSGSHYIFTESKEFWNLQLNELGTTGCVFIGGGAGTCEEYMRYLQDKKPVIMIDGSGRFTEEVAHLHFRCLQQQLTLQPKPAEEDILRNAGFEPKDWVSQGVTVGQSPGRPHGGRSQKRTEVWNTFLKQFQTDLLMGRPPPGVKKQLFFGQNELGDIESLKYKYLDPMDTKRLSLVYERTGMEICRSVVVLDPFSKEQHRDFIIENQISLCLSNSALLCATGVAMQADGHALRSAWRVHDQLTKTAGHEKRFADRFAWVLMICSVLSVCLSLLHKRLQVAEQQFGLVGKVSQLENATGSAAEVDDEIAASVRLHEALPEGTEDWVGAALAVLPLLASFLLGINLRFRFAMRWSQAESARQLVESEIYRFRTRAGHYAVVGPTSGIAGLDGEQTEATTSGRMSRELQARQIFNDRIKECYDTCMGEMGISSLQVSHRVSREDLLYQKSDFPLIISDPKPRRPTSSKVTPERRRSDTQPPVKHQETTQLAEADTDEEVAQDEPGSGRHRWNICLGRKRNDRPYVPERGMFHISIDEYCEERVFDTLEFFDKEAKSLTRCNRLA